MYPAVVYESYAETTTLINGSNSRACQKVLARVLAEGISAVLGQKTGKASPKARHLNIAISGQVFQGRYPPNLKVRLTS